MINSTKIVDAYCYNFIPLILFLDIYFSTNNVGTCIYLKTDVFMKHGIPDWCFDIAFSLDLANTANCC